MTSYAEQVAADIQARYGIPVSPEVVQVIPAGAASEAFEYPVWDGKALIYPSLMGEAGLAMKASKANGVSAYERQKKFERADAKAAIKARTKAEPKPRQPTFFELYKGRIEVLAAKGLTALQIAADLGIHESTCRSIIRGANIAVAKPVRLAVTPPVQSRRDRLAMLLAKGMSQPEARDLIGCRQDTLVRDLLALGIKPQSRVAPPKPATPPKPLKMVIDRKERADAIKERIRGFHAEGKTSAQIAPLVDRHLNSVTRALREMGLKPHKHVKAIAMINHAKARRLECVAMRNQGMTLAEIGEAMNIAVRTVFDMLKREGVRILLRSQQPQVIAQVRRMHAAGDSVHAISRACQIGKPMVCKILAASQEMQVAA